MRFPCPACKARISIADEWMGKQTICPYCREKVRVPDIVMAEPDRQSLEEAADTRKAKRKAGNAMSCAILGFIFLPIGYLFFPPIVIASVPFGLFAVGLGNRAKRNKEARTTAHMAVVLGLIEVLVPLGLMVLGIILFIRKLEQGE